MTMILSLAVLACSIGVIITSHQVRRLSADLESANDSIADLAGAVVKLGHALSKALTSQIVSGGGLLGEREGTNETST